MRLFQRNIHNLPGPNSLNLSTTLTPFGAPCKSCLRRKASWEFEVPSLGFPLPYGYVKPFLYMEPYMKPYGFCENQDTLWLCENSELENRHVSWENPLKVVIFNSKLLNYQRVRKKKHGKHILDSSVSKCLSYQSFKQVFIA